MALLASRSPQFVSQRRLGGIRQPYTDLRPAIARGRAISAVGDALVVWADKLKKQRDAAVVGELYNQWRDKDREVLSELLSRKGRNATGLQTEYANAFIGSFSDVDAQTENGTQQVALRGYLERKREQNLDILARYEAQEGHRYRKEQEEAFVNNAIRDAMGHGFDDMALQNTILDTLDYITRANPGMSEEAIEDLQNLHKSKIVYANMDARIDINATRALPVIEGWKEVLGSGYDSLINKAEKQAKTELTENLRNQLMADYSEGNTPDFDAMEDEIHKSKNVPEDIKDTVVSWIKAQEAEFNRRENERKAQLKDSDLDGIYRDMRAGNFTAALDKTLNASGLTEREKFRIEKYIREQTPDEEATDQLTFIEMQKKALRGEATDDEIISLIGEGLEFGEAIRMINENRKAQDRGEKELNKAKEIAADTIEKRLLKGSAFTGYSSESIADAYEGFKEFIRRTNNPPEGVSVWDMLDPESQHYIVDEIVNKHTPGFQEDLQRQIQRFNKKSQDKRRRQPGETVEEYLKRTRE